MKFPIENLPFTPRLILGSILFVFGIISFWFPSTTDWIDFTSGFALSFGFIVLLTLLPEAKEKMKRN